MTTEHNLHRACRNTAECSQALLKHRCSGQGRLTNTSSQQMDYIIIFREQSLLWDLSTQIIPSCMKLPMSLTNSMRQACIRESYLPTCSLSSLCSIRIYRQKTGAVKAVSTPWHLGPQNDISPCSVGKQSLFHNESLPCSTSGHACL